MQYTGSLEQKRVLIAALRQLHARGVSDGELESAISKALGQGKIPGFTNDRGIGVSRATIQRFREKYDPETSQMKYRSAGQIYNFLLQARDYETPILAESPALIDTSHELSPLISHFVRHFGAEKTLFDENDLTGLEGTYHLYRKAWTSLSRKTYIRSVLQFKRYGASLIYTDRQKYFDPVVERDVDQSDTGFAIPFNLSLVMIGKGSARPLLKFGAFQGFSPLPRDNVPVEEFSGIVTVVYNKWQHIGSPALARRVKPEFASSKFYNEGEIDRVIEQNLDTALKQHVEHLFSA